MSKAILDINPEALSYRIAFSYKLKQLVSCLVNMKMEIVHDKNYSSWYYDFTQEQNETFLPLWNMTLGRMLQLFATEALRDNFDEDIWVKALAQIIVDNHMRYKESRDTYLFIPDWRFPNEIKLKQYIKELIADSDLRVECCYVKVHRKIDVDEQKGGREIEHSSENSLGDANCSLIDNNGTLEELFNECKSYAKNEIYPSTNAG